MVSLASPQYMKGNTYPFHNAVFVSNNFYTVQPQPLNQKIRKLLYGCLRYRERQRIVHILCDIWYPPQLTCYTIKDSVGKAAIL